MKKIKTLKNGFRYMKIGNKSPLLVICFFPFPDNRVFEDVIVFNEKAAEGYIKAWEKL